MVNANLYESIHFENSVNVISAAAFPCVFPQHWHMYAELLVVSPEQPLPEAVHIKVNKTEILLHQGDMLFIWAGELHGITENTNHQTAGIQFPMSLLSGLREFAPYLNFFKTLHHIKQSEKPELISRCQVYISAILAAAEKKQPFWAVESVSLLYALFSDLALSIRNSLQADSASGTVLSNTLEKISRTCSYIQNNCQNNITLDMAAEYAGFSCSYFSRIFKRLMQYSFVEYIALQRIKKAQSLLAETEQSITEISYLSGFKSISTFNRVFKQMQGCSPREYRAYNLEKLV